MNVILVDDEINNIRNLQLMLLENFNEINILGSFQTVNDTKDFIERYSIDLIFLDINMPERDGFDLLELFPERSFQVIFVTAYEEYALKALKAGATDYIMKPILISDLKTAVEKALQNHKEKYTFKPFGKISLNYSGGKAIFDVEEIIYIQGIDNMSKIFLINNRKIMVSKTLKYFEKLIPDIKFFRVHKSYIVNLSHSVRIDSSPELCIVLDNGVKLPISRRNSKPLNDFFKSQS